MSADNNTTNSSDNGVESVESLTLTLQQIAASAQTNTEQFESQKKQFFEQFSQLFGSVNNMKQKKTNVNHNNDPPTCTLYATKPPIPNILSPSMDRTINTCPTAPKSTPSIQKQNSFSAQSDSNNTINTINTNNSTPSETNPTLNFHKISTTTPINTFNIAQATANATNNTNLFSPQQIFQSVPMSLISNNSTNHSTMYQYPYITSGPNQILSSPNLHNIFVPNINNIKPPNIMNNLSFTPTANTIKSSQSVTAVTPVNKAQFMSTYSTSSQGTINTPNTNTNTNNVTAYESYWMRRILSNILLLFFRYHPNGVLECELSQFYEQMFNEQLVLTMDLKYLLCVHKSILITNTKERGQLYTLADDQISSFLQEFDSVILQQWIIKHIRRLFRCFPNGIACNCLQDLLYNMVEFKLQDVIPHGKWHDFVCNIPTMYCCNINGVNIFITIDLNELNKIYNKISTHNVGHGEHVINSNNIQYYLSNYLNFNNILSRPVGYCELLIVLLANYYTQDINNPYYKGIDGETLEKAFHHQYQSRLVHEAPFIQDVLGKICDIIVQNHDNNSQTKLYKLVASSKQYFDTQPDAFAPILHRSLELINNNNIPTCVTATLDESNVPQSPFKEDHVSVFMGGFSHGTTIEDLRNELAKKGVTMISSSGISYRNYGWSFVTLSNDKEAQYLISISPIQIMGRNIDIRPFINRQRIRNHISNKPSDKVMLKAMIELLHKLHGNGVGDGLTVADIQSKLFRRFSYRIDGPQLTKIVGDNPKYLYIKRQQTERIYLTPKLSMNKLNMSVDELKNKISKLWKHISCNYRGNKYKLLEVEEKEKDDDEKNDQTSEGQPEKDKKNDKEVDDNKEETATSKSVLSTTSTKSSKSSGKRSRRRGKNRNKSNTTPTKSIPNQSTPIPEITIAPPPAPAPVVVIENEYTISENDFENEFARRYRFAVCANNFGFNSVKELLESLSVPFKVIIYEAIDDNSSTNSYPKTKPYTIAPDNNNNFNKNNLNINLTSPNIVNPNANITSPRYINSPSNYSNYSNHSYSAHPPQRSNNNNNTNAANYVGFVPYNNTTVTDTQTVSSPANITPQGNGAYSAAQLLQYQQYAMQQQLPANKVTMPYVIGGNSVSNYSIIPSVPNSIITSNSLNSQPNANNNNINLNTINMNINMRPYLNMSNMSNMQAVTNAVSARQKNINSNVNNNNSATK